MVGKSGQPDKKSRKYGKSADDLQDRLDFVAALLALADEEITIPPDQLKAQFQLEWVKADELRVSGIIEQKQRNGQIKRIEKGITKKELGVLLETYRQQTLLERARNELIQNAFVCLGDLGILKEHESAKNQGYWIFSLCLKCKATREENLQVIQDKWKDFFGKLPEPNHPPQLTATLKRCILGLKGSYQEAQQKLTEITQTLQTRLKDKTLSILKVEEGSIILIVQSSQTGYEQLKTLIGQEIAGFSVEYAIDEWQDICRRMLLDRKPLSSNTVLGQFYGDRNLIDDDLFVDLALVKPKRSQNPKHPQEIDPEKGSDLFTRQEETIEKRFDYQEFLDEVISKRTEKQMAIIGEPGAGKTTLLQKLAFWLLQETDDLVIWVSLAELGNQPLGEYLEQKWLKEALGLSREEIKADWEQKFKGGAVWLLLDGLDEMSQSDQQALNFRGWVMNAPIIITCRLNLWQANPTQLQGFQTYLTQPFQDEQVQEFIRRWFPVEADAESLWSQLQAGGKERIKDLCRNPLRLTLLCATWKVENALPETMAELYAGFVEAIYKWKKKAFTVTKEEKKQLNAALGALAKTSLEAETSRFRLTHRLVCEYFGELDEDSLVLRLGWLNEVGVAEESLREKVYTFYHATFQEYFAALAVEDWDDFLPKDHCDRPVEGKRYRIFEPQWKQVILLWLGRDIAQDNKQAFIRALVEFEDGVGDFYGNQAYFLATGAINECKTCSLGNEIVRQVVQWGFGYFNAEKQEWRTFLDPIEEAAKKAIPETIRQLVITELIDILDHCQDNNTRWQAAKSLGEIDPGNPEAIAGLLNLIATTKNELTRRQAAESLEKIGVGNPEAIAGLLNLIATTKNELTRRRAAESLEKIGQGNPEVIAGLVNLIATTKNELTRRQAAESVGEIGVGNPEAIAGLVNLIATTKNELTRRRAAESLEKIGQGNLEVIAGLLNLTATTKNELTRRRAAESLGKIGQGNPEAIAALVNLIATTEDGYTRWQAVQSLGKIGQGNPEAITGLVNLIATTENERTQWLAAKSLGEIDPGNPEAIAALVNLIATTEDEDTRRDAVQSLGKIGQGNPEAIAALVNIIATTENERTQWLAAESLREIGQGNPEAITGLVNLIATTDDGDTRWLAAKSLGEIDPGNSEAIAGLVNIIATTEDEWTRREAAASLGEIGEGNPEAISALLNIIATTKNEWTRIQAVESLREIGEGNPEAITGLVNIIATTDDGDTRWQAVQSLGKIGEGNPEAITGLVNLIATTEDERTQWQAAESLGKIGQGNPEAITGLVNLIATTEDEWTRSQAAESLREIDPGNSEAISALLNIIATTENGYTRRQAAESLREIGEGNPEAIVALVNLIATTEDEDTRREAAASLGEIGQGNPEAIAALLKVIATTENERTQWLAPLILGEILTTPQQYAWVVSALKDCLSDEVYQNDFHRFDECYKVIWNCAENLPYPDFYQAWHNPPTTPHPEVTKQTPHKSEPSFAPINLAEALQNQPILILNAQPLANETREGEIALTLCGLIWKQVCPQQMYPRVSTPADLCYAIDELKFTLNLPHRALLLTDCEHPTPELITFCEKLTRVIAVAFLTEEPLEAPLKGFPPNQPNLISAIETWLEEI